MIILKIKRFIKAAVQLVLPFFYKHHTLRHYCTKAIKFIGLYDYVLRVKFDSNAEQIIIPLTPHEEKVYQQIKKALKTKGDVKPFISANKKKRLAYISPLPPLRSGISDYSADLLPLLAGQYDIDVIVVQDSVSDDWITDNCQIRSVSWFRNHATEFDHVIYHFGNSPFHKHMFSLLNEIPGIVVLHDFYLGHVAHGCYEKAFGDYVYNCHGYNAVTELHQSKSREQIIWQYPLNVGVLQNAQKVIVHSKHSQHLAKLFYGSDIADDWSVIPLLRPHKNDFNRNKSRQILGFSSDDFIICSLGLTGPIKLNHRLLQAWLASDLAQDNHCVLLFVGENDAADYGEELLKLIGQSNLADRIRITGWTDEETFHHYLAASDMAVQLRTRSRGETSAAVLDCMSYGLPTIINANGSMTDFPDDVVYKLSDVFDDIDLTHALETLWRDQAYREHLSYKAKERLSILHDPSHCAHQYISAIEAVDKFQLSPLIRSWTHLARSNKTDSDLKILAQEIAPFSPPHIQQRQLLIDISAIALNDLKTGIQRVVRAQLEVLLRTPPVGYRVEPVFLTHSGNKWHYEYARQWTSQFLGLENELPGIADSPVEFFQNDILFCADLVSGLIVPADRDAHLFQKLINAGVHIYFQVYDILPISHPQWFLKEAEGSHIEWAKVVANSNGAFCISNTVANELKHWMMQLEECSLPAESVTSFHLGADIDTSSPSKGFADNAKDVLDKLANAPSFLMVGTLEPRKGHTQTLAAFEKLWQKNHDINLVIVGKQGWFVEKLIKKLQNHKENYCHLFWLDGISDEYLEKIYQACQCLIAASEGEGFGLPLIEAAQHQLPIIARDIPVFREVAGEHAYYFNGDEPESLENTINTWLELKVLDNHPKSIDMPWLTWQESTEQLVNLMGLELSKNESK